MYNRILVPVDGAEPSMKALDDAIRLSKSLNPPPTITVLHAEPRLVVVEPTLGIDYEARTDQEGTYILEKAVERLKSSEVAFKAVRIDGDPAVVICETAKEERADLIMMGSRGAGFLSEIVLGSVSHSVAKHAECPVMIIK